MVSEIAKWVYAWGKSAYIIPLFKGKVDSFKCSNYKGDKFAKCGGEIGWTLE